MDSAPPALEMPVSHPLLHPSQGDGAVKSWLGLRPTGEVPGPTQPYSTPTHAHLHTHTTHHPLLRPLILRVSLPEGPPPAPSESRLGPWWLSDPGPEWSPPCTAAHRNPGTHTRHTHNTHETKSPCTAHPTHTDRAQHTHMYTLTHSTSHTHRPTTQGPNAHMGT